MKKCSKCCQFKDVQLFYKDRQKTDGLTSKCKQCFNELEKINRLDSTYVKKMREKSKNNQRKRRLNAEIRIEENQYRMKRYHNDSDYRLKIIERNSNFRSRKRMSDPKTRAIDNCRRRLSLFLKGKKRLSFSKMLGCSLAYFKAYIESQFKPGMTWDNYGKWHIDHIYPLSIAYEEGMEKFVESCKYTNLQPLWCSDNIKKGNKVILNKD